MPEGTSAGMGFARFALVTVAWAYRRSGTDFVTNSWLTGIQKPSWVFPRTRGDEPPPAVALCGHAKVHVRKEPLCSQMSGSQYD